MTKKKDVVDYGKLDKRIVFTTNDHKHAQFILKLKYDGFTQSNFFRLVINAYIEENETLRRFVDEIKDQSKKKINHSLKLRQRGKQIVGDLALNEGEIENIFDILAEELPDL